MDKRLKVLLITNLFPTPVAPTRGVFVYEMVRHLRDHCDVQVICPLPFFPPWRILKRFKEWHALSQVPASYVFDGIQVHSPKYFLVPRLSEGMHAMLMFLGIWKTIRSLNRSWGFDLINGQWMYPDGVAAARAAERLGKPVVIGGHGSDVNFSFDEPAKRRQMVRSFQYARAVTVVSNAMKKKLMAGGVDGNNISVVSNGFDPAVFKMRPATEAKKELGLPLDRRVVLFAGRMLEAKGVVELLEAFRKIMDAHPEVDLFLVGSGPASARLERLIVDTNLVGRVKAVGVKPHAEVARWMAACDVFCLPSYSEGCPTVVLEVLACGRPVVATRVGGIPDMINEKNGILIEPRDVSQLAAALKAALAKKWNAGDIYGSVENLTWTSIAKTYARLFMENSDDRKSI